MADVASPDSLTQSGAAMLHCSCGYTCGTHTALARHLTAKNGEGDESHWQVGTAEQTPPSETEGSSHTVGLATAASEDHRGQAGNDSLDHPELSAPIKEATPCHGITRYMESSAPVATTEVISPSHNEQRALSGTHVDELTEPLLSSSSEHMQAATLQTATGDSSLVQDSAQSMGTEAKQVIQAVVGAPEEVHAIGVAVGAKVMQQGSETSQAVLHKGIESTSAFREQGAEAAKAVAHAPAEIREIGAVACSKLIERGEEAAQAAGQTGVTIAHNVVESAHATRQHGAEFYQSSTEEKREMVKATGAQMLHQGAEFAHAAQHTASSVASAAAEAAQAVAHAPEEIRDIGVVVGAKLVDQGKEVAQAARQRGAAVANQGAEAASALRHHGAEVVQAVAHSPEEIRDISVAVESKVVQQGTEVVQAARQTGAAAVHQGSESVSSMKTRAAERAAEFYQSAARAPPPSASLGSEPGAVRDAGDFTKDVEGMRQGLVEAGSQAKQVAKAVAQAPEEMRNIGVAVGSEVMQQGATIAHAARTRGVAVKAQGAAMYQQTASVAQQGVEAAHGRLQSGAAVVQQGTEVVQTQWQHGAEGLQRGLQHGSAQWRKAAPYLDKAVHGANIAAAVTIAGFMVLGLVLIFTPLKESRAANGPFDRMFWLTQGLYLITFSIPALVSTVQCGVLRKGFERWPEYTRTDLWLGVLKFPTARAIFYVFSGFYVFPLMSNFGHMADVSWHTKCLSYTLGLVIFSAGVFLLVFDVVLAVQLRQAMYQTVPQSPRVV